MYTMLHESTLKVFYAPALCLVLGRSYHRPLLTKTL